MDVCGFQSILVRMHTGSCKRVLQMIVVGDSESVPLSQPFFAPSGLKFWVERNLFHGWLIRF